MIEDGAVDQAKVSAVGDQVVVRKTLDKAIIGLPGQLNEPALLPIAA